MGLLQFYLEAPTLVVLLCCTFLFISFCGVYLWFSYIPHRVLKRNGINGPPPSFFYGNYKEISKHGILKYHEYLSKKYGQIVGFYIGQQPQLLVTDLDLIKAITVKDFDHFVDRPQSDPKIFEILNLPEGLLRAKGDDWRRVRRVISPTFSASKMKMMEPLIVDSANTLVKVFEEYANTGKSVEVFRMFGAFTMESILSTAFGRVMDIQKGESSAITEAAAALFESRKENSYTSIQFLTMITSNLPCLKVVFQALAKHTEIIKGLSVLKDTTNEIIKQRIENSGKHRDLLQFMIDASVEDECTGKKLTNGEIISHSIVFLLAGYETTANALTYTCYLLALHPDIQHKLQEEIDEYFRNNPSSSLYQASQDLKYLDMVINESLRLYPPAPVFRKACNKDYHYGNIVIPKGTTISIPSILLQKDPKYWDNPEECNAFRFTPEEKAKRPQMCFLPFGAGPRNCIGMRFALMEAKIALMLLMKKVSFVRSADTEVPLKSRCGITMSPTNGVYINIALREV